MADFETIPQGAIDHLLANPETTAQFDGVFGAGRAAEVLASRNPVPEEDDWTVAGETFRATVGGVRDAAQETAEFAQSAGEGLGNWLTGGRDVYYTKEEGFKILTQEEVESDSYTIPAWQTRDLFGEGDQGTLALPEVADNKTMVGGMGRGIVQFTAGYLAGSRLTGLKGLKGAFLNGALADAVVFDPNDPNITAALGQFGIDTGVVGEILATDPDDPEYINRLRNATEGVLAGAIVEGIGWGIRAARAAKNGDEAAAARFTEEQNKALGALDEAIEEAGTAVRQDIEETFDLSKELFDPLDDVVTPEAARVPDADGQLRLDLGDTPLAPNRVADEARAAPVSDSRRIFVTPERAEKIRMGARLAAGGKPEELARGFSFKSLTTISDFDEVLEQIAAARHYAAEEFAKIKGGDVQRWSTVKAQAAAKLRQLAQLTGEDPKALVRKFMSADLGDVTQIAAEIHARSRMVLTVEKELKEMAEAISSGQFDPKKWPGIKNMDHLRLAFSQRREVASNLLAGQDALRTNVARAMNAMKMAVKGDENLQKMLRDPSMFKDIDAAAKAVADPANAGQSATKTIDETLAKLHGYMDRINSFRINALLSGPGTQEVNLISNVVNSFVIPAEQALGAMIRGDHKLMVHAMRQLQGTFAGLRDSVGTALKAGWWDEAILDPFNGKIEGDVERGLITGLKPLDKIIALPSRALMTMDEFFKQSAYRGRIFADANAAAAEKGLKGEARTDFIKQALRDAYTPSATREDALKAATRQGIRPEDTEAFVKKYLRENAGGQATNGEALLQSRRTTFTEPLEPGVASQIQKLAIDYPLIRFVIPFVRTPINILSQTYQHFPAIGMTSKRYRADIQAGGVRAAQARGRQAVGTALVGMAGYLAASGYITGAGPSDPRIRRVWLKNNQPYSFRIQNDDGTVEWISFARLEPLSNVFSIAADAVEIMGDEYNESEKTPVIQALIMATMENTVNKTFTQGIYDAMSLFVGRPHERESAVRNFVASFVPNVLNQTNGDDALREARSITDAILSRTHLYNQVDPKRNVLGEPVVRTLPKYDPLGLTEADVRETDPVLEEITRVAILNQTVADNPARRVPGPSRIELDQVPYSDTQSLYDRWLELTGTVEIGGKTLREELEQTINSRSYQSAPDGFIGAESGTKGTIIRRIISAYREKAKSELPELRQIIQDERRGGAVMLRGQARANRGQLFPQTTTNPLSPRRRTFEDLLGQ